MIRRTLAAGARASEVAAKVQGRVLKALDTPFLSRRLGDWPATHRQVVGSMGGGCAHTAAWRGVR